MNKSSNPNSNNTFSKTPCLFIKSGKQIPRITFTTNTKYNMMYAFFIYFLYTKTVSPILNIPLPAIIVECLVVLPVK